MKKITNNYKAKPSLRFTPTAWAKLLYMRDVTDNEVGGFGITNIDDLLLVTDFVIVKQKVTAVSISFDDTDVADFFDEQVDVGRKPEQFARIWLHTHPGNLATPSSTDEETFARVFGKCEWSIMCIVAKGGETFARLRFNTGPGGDAEIPVYVDYSKGFDATDFEAWKVLYKKNVMEDKVNLLGNSKISENSKDVETKQIEIFGDDGMEDIGSFYSMDELLEEIELMHPLDRQVFIDELTVRSELWENCESEVFYE